MKRVILAVGAFALSACSGGGAVADDPVSHLFEDHYQEFVAAAGSHHAACDVSLSAKGPAGEKHDSVTTTVDVDASGNHRVTHEDGSEVVHVGTHAWVRKNGKTERVEAGSHPDLERDGAVAQWRVLLEPMRDRVKLKKTGSGTLKTATKPRATELYALTLEAGGNADGPKVDKGSGTVEVDADTQVPVKVELTASWSAPVGASKTRVSYVLEKLSCSITDVGAGKAIDAPEAIGAKPAGATTETPAPSAFATATATAAKSTPKPTAKPTARPAATAKPAATPRPKPTTTKTR